MEIQESLRIIRALADGVNPETGEVLTGEAVYQYPSAVRALHQAIAALEWVEERGNKHPCPQRRANRGRARKISKSARNCAEELIFSRSRRRTIGP